MTPMLGWFLLLVCVGLMLISAYVAFAMQARYRLDVVLATEAEPLQIDRGTRNDILQLHEALALAMDWYRGEQATPAHSGVADTTT